VSIFQKLRAAIFPEPAPVKAPTSVQSVQKYLGKARASTISNSATNTTNSDRSSFSRNAGTLNGVVANLARVSPDVSQALATKISSAISRTYTVIAYDAEGLVHEEGTKIAQAFALRLDTLPVDSSKFTRSSDLRTLSSSLLLDSLRYGSMMSELVLGKGRVPLFIKPISTAAIKWGDSGDKMNSYPIYKGPTEDIILDFPTIFYSASQQDNDSAYPDSPIQAAIQPALHDAEFQDVLRRAAHRQMLQRLTITINSQMWKENLPLEVQSDETKLREAISNTISQVETQINGLSPEDALVLFDNLTVGNVNDSNRSEDKTIGVLTEIINGNVASGAKILPSMIGRGASSSAASTEAQLFVKAVAFAQIELNAIYSRAFTVAARLMGQPVYVKFAYEDVNLRPELELESFKSVRQSRILDQLSLGLISDIEASIVLTGSLPPAGYKSLAGTYFKVGPVDTKQNDYSNTSATADGKTDSTQTTKDSAPDTPTGVPGRNRK